MIVKALAGGSARSGPLSRQSGTQERSAHSRSQESAIPLDNGSLRAALQGLKRQVTRSWRVRKSGARSIWLLHVSHIPSMFPLKEFGTTDGIRLVMNGYKRLADSRLPVEGRSCCGSA